MYTKEVCIRIKREINKYKLMWLFFHTYSLKKITINSEAPLGIVLGIYKLS